MSTQYNAIQAPYDLIRQNTIALLERDNIRTTLQPHIANARVLDLACGSGFYSHAFLSWGAASVVGVDISSAMLAQARRNCPDDVDLLDPPAAPPPPPPGGRRKTVTFIESDAGASPAQIFGGGAGDDKYDIVFAAWLLNYAANPAQLTAFYETIAANLAPERGRFVGITVPPAANPRESIAMELRLRPREKGGSGGLVYEPLRDVGEEEEEEEGGGGGKGGVLFRAHGETEVGEVAFECWYLEKRWYEECARKGGLRGPLTWGKTDPRAWLERGQWEGGASREEMESYEVYPSYGILVIEKS